MSAPLPERLTTDPNDPADLRNERGRLVAVANGVDYHSARALSAEIARRYNAHAALVEALRRVVVNDQGRCYGCGRMPGCCPEACKFPEIRAALRAAEVKS